MTKKNKSKKIKPLKDTHQPRPPWLTAPDKPPELVEYDPLLGGHPSLPVGGRPVHGRG